MAAGMWDRVLSFLGFEEEEDEEEMAAEPELALAAAAPAQGRSRVAAETRRHAAPARPARTVAPAEGRSGGDYRAGSARAATVTRLVPAGIPGFVVSAPRRFEDSQEAADQLKSGKPVLLHLDGVERELAQRVINFLAGSVYALGGEMHRVGATVLFVPAGIEVTLPLSLRMGERDGR